MTIRTPVAAGTTVTAEPTPLSAAIPEISPGVERLAGDLASSLAGSDVEAEAIPGIIRQNPIFRAGLYFRVFLALVFTALLIWAGVRGAGWVDIFGGTVTTAAFWTVTIAAFRGIRISNLR